MNFGRHDVSCIPSCRAGPSNWGVLRHSWAVQHPFNDSSARASFSGVRPRGGVPEDADCISVTIQLVSSIWVFTETSKDAELPFEMNHPRGLPMMLSGAVRRRSCKHVRKDCKGSLHLVGRDTSDSVWELQGLTSAVIQPCLLQKGEICKPSSWLNCWL